MSKTATARTSAEKTTAEKEEMKKDFFESAVSYCQAFANFDKQDSQCKTCKREDESMYSACEFFSLGKKTTTKKSSSVERDFLNNSVNANCHTINTALLFDRLTVKELAEKASTKEARVNAHLAYLRNKQSHKVRILRENNKVFLAIKRDFVDKFNETFEKACESVK